MNTTSVAIATYNGEAFLEQQLESIENQTTPPTEIVICDDNSTDRTASIIKNFQNKALFPVHFFQNSERLGSVRNFEKAISLCNGEVILLSDQDDIWKSNRIASSLSVIEKNSCGYVFSNADLIDSNQAKIQGNLWSLVGFNALRQNEFSKPNMQAMELIRRNFVTGATMAFKASLREIFLPFPNDLENSMHHDAWISLALSAAGHSGVALPDALIDYRLHPQQQIGTKGSAFTRFFRRFQAPRKSLLGELKTLNLLKENRKISQSAFYTHLGVHLEHIKFRIKILEENSRLIRIKPITLHYLQGGYRKENFPLLSAVKDIMF